MIDREVFSKRLKELRLSRNVSMQELALSIGLKNKGSIGQFETKLNIPSGDGLVALANYFNVSLDYLVGLSDNPERNEQINTHSLKRELHIERVIEYSHDQ